MHRLHLVAFMSTFSNVYGSQWLILNGWTICVKNNVHSHLPFLWFQALYPCSPGFSQYHGKSCTINIHKWQSSQVKDCVSQGTPMSPSWQQAISEVVTESVLDAPMRNACALWLYDLVPTKLASGKTMTRAQKWCRWFALFEVYGFCLNLGVYLMDTFQVIDIFHGEYEGWNTETPSATRIQLLNRTMIYSIMQLTFPDCM